MSFELRTLLTDVFQPQPGERVLVACDVPRSPQEDSPAWQERRKMAEEWREAFAALGAKVGFTVMPLLTYPATGSNGAPLPATGTLGGKAVSIEETALESTLAAFLTQFSATAPLDGFCKKKEDFRAASMPGIQKWMEETSLSADYREVARRCRLIDEALRGADSLDVVFSTGHTCHFDLRYRKPEVDDGQLPRFKAGDRIINLPSGETFIVPYEGERPGEPSRTEGTLPVQRSGEQVLLQVRENRIVKVEGGAEAKKLEAFFKEDPARANVAEVAVGCNDRAKVTGNVLEDEKAGFHWAFGRSDHLGGTVGVAAFKGPKSVVHEDIVYAVGNPIQVVEAVAHHGAGERPLIRKGASALY